MGVRWALAQVTVPLPGFALWGWILWTGTSRCNSVNMPFRILIQLQMHDRQPVVDQQPHVLIDADRAVVEGVVAPAISMLTAGVAEGINQHAAAVQQVAQLVEHRLVHVEREMKEAVPCDDEVELLIGVPAADVLVKECVLRMVLAGKSDHFRRNVQAGDGKVLLLQDADESSTSATTHVQGFATGSGKAERFFELRYAVGGVDVLGVPPGGDPVVFAAEGLGVHDDEACGRDPDRSVS